MVMPVRRTVVTRQVTVTCDAALFIVPYTAKDDGVDTDARGRCLLCSRKGYLDGGPLGWHPDTTRARPGDLIHTRRCQLLPAINPNAQTRKSL